MAKFPAMPFWFDAYWLDCSHLTDAEHGRYLLVLKELWTAPQQRIPNDDEWLARKFRRPVEAMRSEIRPILTEFCECDGNWWRQNRLIDEMSYLLQKQSKQSARAKSRWNKEKDLSRGNATHTHTHTLERKKEDGAPNGAAPAPNGTAIDLDADLYRLGRQILGKSGGAMVTKAKKALGLGGAVELFQIARTKDVPVEYIAAALRDRTKARADLCRA
ncbi:MAG: DUF1376 domain-containing protein [Geminicoccaceae bacterium]